MEGSSSPQPFSPRMREWITELIAIGQQHGIRSEQARAFIRSHIDEDPGWEDAACCILLLFEAQAPAQKRERRRRSPTLMRQRIHEVRKRRFRKP